MSIGTLYYSPLSPRSNWFGTLCKYLEFDIELKEGSTVENFSELFPLNKMPAFVAADGFKLTETVAIAQYLVKNSSKPEFEGKTLKEQTLNLKWLSYINSDFFNSAYALYKAETDEQKSTALSGFQKNLKYVDDNLSKSKYLVGENATVCDVFTYNLFSVFSHFGIKYDDFDNIARWYGEMAKHPATNNS